MPSLHPRCKRTEPPLTCCSALALSVPPQKGQSRGAWRVHPTCGHGWVLLVHQGGITAACWKHSCVWLEGRCWFGISTEAPGTRWCTHTVHGVGTACHPGTAAATLQPLSHPESLGVTRGHQHKMDMRLPMLASPTHGTGSRPVQVGDFGVSCPQAWSPWKDVCQHPNWKNIILGFSPSLCPSECTCL